MVARNSEMLDVLLQVAADPTVSWRAVELAGRGISADAAGTLWTLSEKKRTTSAEELADLLMEQADIVDALTAAWRSFGDGELSKEQFESRLEDAVHGLEEWLARVSGA